MRKRNTVIFSTIIMILVMATAVFAEKKSLKNYTDAALKFTMKYPGDWKVQKEEGKKDRVYFVSPDANTMVAVNVMNPVKKMSAKEFLNAMEIELKTKNILEEKDRLYDEEACEALNVDDGYCGTYIMKQDGKEVYSIMNVFTKESKIYFLMISTSSQHELDKFEDILANFRAL